MYCGGISSRHNAFNTIIAYLPKSEDLKQYWDDAFNVDFTEHKEIIFTDRFPKPDYFVSS